MRNGNFFENYFESNLSSLHLHQIKAFLTDGKSRTPHPKKQKWHIKDVIIYVLTLIHLTRHHEFHWRKPLEQLGSNTRDDCLSKLCA